MLPSSRYARGIGNPSARFRAPIGVMAIFEAACRAGRLLFVVCLQPVVSAFVVGFRPMRPRVASNLLVMPPLR